MGDPRHFGPQHKNNAGFGHTVFWRRHGQQYSAKVHGYETEQEAKDAAFAIAEDHGYTQPRWWQFSRWGDSSR